MRKVDNTKKIVKRLSVLVMLLSLGFLFGIIFSRAPEKPAEKPTESTTTTTSIPAEELNVEGRVFQDNDYNGYLSDADTGLEFVVIKAYNSANTETGSTSTDENGKWGLNISEPVRIEVTGQAAWLVEASLPEKSNTAQTGLSRGATLDASTTVFFAKPGDKEFRTGFQNPKNYCQNNPLIAVVCYGVETNEAAVALTPWRSGETIYLPDTKEFETTHSLAWHSTSQTLYGASFTKRGTGLENSLGVLYATQVKTELQTETDLEETEPQSTYIFDTVPNTGLDPHDYQNLRQDKFTYETVGKSGLGGLTLNAAEDRLYVTNLFDKKIYVYKINIDGTTGGFVKTIEISLDADSRPMALTEKDGFLYVGVTNTAETTQNPEDLAAEVLSYSIADEVWESVLSVKLNYARQCKEITIDPEFCSDQNSSINFKPWNDTYDWDQGFQQAVTNAQPWLVDIEILSPDLIALGIRDRFGDQSVFKGTANGSTSEKLYNPQTAGDILLVEKTSNGWKLENKGLVKEKSGHSSKDETIKEFINDETQILDAGGFVTEGLSEIAVGGVVSHPNEESIAFTAQTPQTPQPLTQKQGTGIRWVNEEDGSYQKSTTNLVENQTTFFGANSLGELILLCEGAPISIGNRLWWDVNANGIQDPTYELQDGTIVGLPEPGLQGVYLELYNSENELIGSTVTDDNGEWNFNTRNAPTLAKNRTYTLLVVEEQRLAGGTLVGGEATKTGVGTAFNKAKIDSAGRITTQIETTKAGTNDYNYDIGIVFNVNVDVEIGILKNNETLSINDPDAAEAVNLNQPFTYRVSIENTSVADATNLEIEISLPDVVNYIRHTGDGTFSVSNKTWRVTKLKAEETKILDMTVFIDVQNGQNFTDQRVALINAEIKGLDQGNGNNNQTTEAGYVFVPVADIELELSANVNNGGEDINQNASFGQSIRWVLRLNNNGPDEANDIAVQVPFDNHLTFEQASGSGTYNPKNELWVIESLNVGETAVLFLDTAVTPSYAGENDVTPPPVTLNAEIVESGTIDPDSLANNHSDSEDDQTKEVVVLAGSTLKGIVFEDQNADGIQDDNDIPVPEVKAEIQLESFVYSEKETLVASPGDIVSTAISDETGTYTFNNLYPGEYSVTFEEHEDLVALPGNNTNVTVEKETTSQPRALFIPAKIEGFLWEDQNGNGKLETEDEGLSLEVSLKQNENLIETTTADTNGRYSFTALTPGKYTVVFAETELFKHTTSLEASPVTSRKSEIEIEPKSKETVRNINHGYWQNSTLEGFVFEDFNGNGTQENEEKPLSNIQVSLESETETKSTITDSNGNYLFESLAPGTYKLLFDAGTSHSIGQNQKEEIPETLEVFSGTSNQIAAQPLFLPVAITGTAWVDDNADGTKNQTETSTPSGKIDLYQNKSLVASAEINDGTWTFPRDLNISPGNYTLEANSKNFTNAEFHTANESATKLDIEVKSEGVPLQVDVGFFESIIISQSIFQDTNGNGQQDTNEPYLDNVEIELKGDETYTTSTKNGNYTIKNIKPGSYTLTLSPDNEHIVSLGQKLSGESDTQTIELTLESGTEQTIEKIGMYKPGVIVGKVYEDSNGDNTYGKDEVGIEGITLELEEFGAEVISDANGVFTLEGLAPGKYKLKTKNLRGHKSHTTDFEVSVEHADIIDVTVGAWLENAVTGTITLDSNENGEDENDPGLQGIKVSIANGESTLTDTTNASGRYSITGAKPGTWTITFITPKNYEPLKPVPADLTLESGKTVKLNQSYKAESELEIDQKIKKTDGTIENKLTIKNTGTAPTFGELKIVIRTNAPLTEHTSTWNCQKKKQEWVCSTGKPGRRIINSKETLDFNYTLETTNEKIRVEATLGDAETKIEKTFKKQDNKTWILLSTAILLLTGMLITIRKLKKLQ